MRRISKQGWAPARLVAQLHCWLYLAYLGFFSCKQIPVLIHELLAVELWKDKVFPKILELGFNPTTTLPIYFVVSFTIMLMFTWWYNLLRILLNLQHSLQSVLVLGIPVDLKFASGRHCCIMFSKLNPKLIGSGLEPSTCKWDRHKYSQSFWASKKMGKEMHAIVGHSSPWDNNNIT